MSNDKKIVRMKKREININAATVIIAAVLLYVIICIISAARKEPITTYKVNKSNISNDIILDGLIIRNEQIITSPNAGYVCYYVRDGEKIKKNAMVCTIDQTGQVYNALSDDAGYEEVLTAEDYIDVRNTISLYKVNYSNDNFYEAYNFENSINNKVLELTNEILMQQLSASGNPMAISSVASPYSGIVTYYMDGYESFDINSINAASFDKSAYMKNTLKTGDMISAGEPIVKIIPDDTWYIVAPISNEQIAMLEDDEYISFKLNNSNYQMTMPYELIYANDGTYIKVTVTKYMSNYIAERFISLEIIMEEDTGLKVPVSALVDKEVYLIPTSYLTGGGNQTLSNSLYVQSRDENGNETIKQVNANIYMTVDDVSYIDPKSLDPSDVLVDIQTQETLAVSVLSTETIKGVYSATRGTADFRKVTIKKIDDEFALIESGEEISAYDNIILDASKVTENQILY